MTWWSCPIIKYESCRIVSIILIAEIRPVNPPKVGLQRKPIINRSGVIKEKREDSIVANRFNILIPVGIAIIDVEKVR